jgi:hypothetical protein
MTKAELLEDLKDVAPDAEIYIATSDKWEAAKELDITMCGKTVVILSKSSI